MDKTITFVGQVPFSGSSRNWYNIFLIRLYENNNGGYSNWVSCTVA